MSQKPTESKDPWLKGGFLLGGLLLLVGIWFGLSRLVFHLANTLTITKAENALAKSGQLGDTFGAVNALFTGLAFAGVVYTIIQQNKQLKTQQRELHEQSEDRKLEQFERVFFQLLDQFRTVRDTTQFAGDTGRKVFRGFANDLQKTMPILSSEEGYLETLSPTYEKFYEKYEPQLGQYFRTIYGILDFVELSTIAIKKKSMYANFLRAQLSSDDLILLLYNCRVGQYRSEGKLLALIQRFNTLKHFSKSQINASHHFLLRNLA